MEKTILMGLAISAVILTLSMGATTLIPISSDVYAEKPTNPNLWGKEASELAQAEDTDNEPGSEMGEHTRGSDLNGDEPGRVGVGNIDEELEDLTGEEVEDHPSGVVDFLCNGGGDCPEPAPAD